MKLKEYVLNSKQKTMLAVSAVCASIMASTVSSFAATVPAYATFTAYQGMTADSIMDGVKQLFATIGTYGGAFYGIFAIFTLLLAIRNEDNEGRNKAALNLLAAIALLSTGVILNLFFVP